MMKQQLPLLDTLAQRMGCAYLSDLHRHFGSTGFRACVADIPFGLYPLAQWQETVEYLFQQSCPACADETEARLRLTQGKTAPGLLH